jgi:ATP-binding protein involved in chromosome partitioning
MLELPHAKIANVIAIASGKGGVGKSTVAANVARALKEKGYRVGIMDADIMGPTIPIIFGLSECKVNIENGLIEPVTVEGLKIMSIGFLMNESAPAVIRGAMVTKYLRMLITNVMWGELDYLIVDMPPGTGDIHISLCQSVIFSGAIIVTTPHDISFKISSKGMKMFELVSVPILGIVENMSTGADANIKTAGIKMSELSGVSSIRYIPFDVSIAQASDSGVVIRNKELRACYENVAEMIVGSIESRVSTFSKPFSWDWSSNSGAPQFTKQRDNGISDIYKKDQDTMSIVLDGGIIDIDIRALRSKCTCAACKNAKDSKTSEKIVPIKINSVGNYGIRILWSDGHSSGIYSFKNLIS